MHWRLEMPVTFLAAQATEIIEPPSWGDALVGLADYLFGSIVAWFVSLLVSAWIFVRWAGDTYRGSRLAGAKVLSAVRFSVQHLRRVPVPRAFFAVFATLAGLALQAAWLGLTYLFICAVVQNWRSFFGERTTVLFEWNTVTGSYTLSCFLLVLVSYVMAATGNDDGVPLLGLIPALLPALVGAIIALLAALLSVLSVVVWVLGLLVGLVTGGEVATNWSDLGFFWLSVLCVALYIVMGFVALGTSTVLASVWKRAPDTQDAKTTA